MPRFSAASTLVLLLGIVLFRVFWLRRTGTEAMHFGNIDKTDCRIVMSQARQFVLGVNR